MLPDVRWVIDQYRWKLLEESQASGWDLIFTVSGAAVLLASFFLHLYTDDVLFGVVSRGTTLWLS